MIDTVQINADGKYIFQADSLLIPGVYMLVLPPENEFVTLLINENEQRFSVKTDARNITEKIEIKGSPDNTLYYDYSNYLNHQVAQLGQYRQAAAESVDAAEQEKYKKQFNEEVGKIRAYQLEIIEEYPLSLTASLIKVELENEIPDFSHAAASEREYLRYAFRKKHYFDWIDMQDERLLRSEALFEKVDYYLNRLTHARPDSVNVAVDKILDLFPPKSKSFKYYLDHLMLSYASSNYVGMDAVYVHIVENYYAKGLAPWVAEDDLAEMVDDVTHRKHLLLGKTAPNVQMQLRDGTPFALHDVQANFTVLYLWQPNCSHCKKSLPFMKDFYQKFKDKGVKIFAACTKTNKQIPKCWEYVDENEIGEWTHAVDPFLKSRFVQKYMAKKTPKIFILDKNKTIVMKDIGAEQLEEVMNDLLAKEVEGMGKS